MQALDKAANVAVADYKAYYHGPGGGPVDTAAPVTQLHTQPAQPDGNHGWFVTPVTITLAATDDFSGVAYTQYRLQDGAWLTYTMPFVLAAEGEMAVAYRSVDLENNQEITHTQPLSLDMTAPTSTANAPPAVATGSITVTWTAADMLSGSDGVWLWYKFGLSGAWLRSSLSFQSGDSGLFSFAPTDGPGVYCFATQALDLAGNEEAAPIGAGDGCTEHEGSLPEYVVYLPVVQRP